MRRRKEALTLSRFRQRPWLAALSMLAMLFGITVAPLLSGARSARRMSQSSCATGTSFTDPTETANAEEVVVQFGYIVDVLAPAEFNEMMLSGFQTILVGDKTAEQQTADLQTAWAEGMGAVEATPSE